MFIYSSKNKDQRSVVTEGEPLRAVLVSLRDPADPMAAHEHRCFCEAAGVPELEVICAATEELDDSVLEADVLFFGGSGSFSVLDSHRWVKRFLDFLPQVPERDIPAWASCFAFQGLALAMGGVVVRDEARKQIGACQVHLTESGRQDLLFQELPASFYAQFGHHDHVTRVPEGFTILATGNGDAPQAFRVRGANFWGAQFHPELQKQTTLERWNFYRDKYKGNQGKAIDRRLRGAPDTPEVKRLLRALVCLVRERAPSAES